MFNKFFLIYLPLKIKFKIFYSFNLKICENNNKKKREFNEYSDLYKNLISK